MCSRKLKTCLLSLALLCSSLFLPSTVYLCAEVRLTDEEANEIMNEIQLSKEELEKTKSELSESKKESQELKKELVVVKNIYLEQKKSYETQLSEAEEKEQNLEKALTASVTTTILMTIFAVTMFFL